MKKLRYLITIAAALAFITTPASASNQGPGRISYVHVMNNGVVLFLMSVTRGAVPGCATPQPTRWAFNGATAAGQAKLSLLLTAYASGKSITVYGTGTCLDFPDTETLDWFVTMD